MQNSNGRGGGSSDMGTQHPGRSAKERPQSSNNTSFKRASPAASSSLSARSNVKVPLPLPRPINCFLPSAALCLSGSGSWSAPQIHLGLGHCLLACPTECLRLALSLHPALQAPSSRWGASTPQGLLSSTAAEATTLPLVAAARQTMQVSFGQLPALHLADFLLATVSVLPAQRRDSNVQQQCLLPFIVRLASARGISQLSAMALHHPAVFHLMHDAGACSSPRYR